MTVTPRLFLNQKGPIIIIPSSFLAIHAIDPSKCTCVSLILLGCDEPQNTQFFELIFPQGKIWASSLNLTWHKNETNLLDLLKNPSQMFTLSFELDSYIFGALESDILFKPFVNYWTIQLTTISWINFFGSCFTFLNLFFAFLSTTAERETPRQCS